MRRKHILDWFSSHATFVDSLSVDVGSLILSSLNEYLQILGPSLRFLQIDLGFVIEGTCSSFLPAH
jgi:hypothetical protein